MSDNCIYCLVEIDSDDTCICIGGDLRYTQKENAKLKEENACLKDRLKHEVEMIEGAATDEIKKLKEENARLRLVLKELVESIYKPYLLGLAVKPNEDWVALNFAKQLLERGEK